MFCYNEIYPKNLPETFPWQWKYLFQEDTIVCIYFCVLCILIINTLYIYIKQFRRRDLIQFTRSLTELANSQSDLEVKANLNDIKNDTSKCLENYQNVLEKEGNVVLAQKQALIGCEKANKLKIQKMKTSLESLSSKVEGIRNDVFMLETKVHIEIESTRMKSKQLEEEKEKKYIDLTATNEQIDLIPSQITNLERECNNLENDARKLTNRANELEDEKLKHSVLSAVGFGVTAIGTVLLPVTGEVYTATKY